MHGAPGWLARLIQPTQTLVQLGEPPLDAVLAASRGRRAPADTLPRLRLAVAADRAALRDCGADIAIVDNRRSAGLAAESLGIPWLSLTGGLVLGPHSAVAPTASEFSRVVGPIMGVPASHMRRTGRLLQLDDHAPVSPQAMALGDGLTQLIDQVGARPRRFVHELAMGDRTLVLDHPDLLPTRDLPDSVVQPGPLLAQVGEAPDLPLKSGPRAWLTAGATGDSELLPRLAWGLRGWGIEVVVSGKGAEQVPDCVSLPLAQLDALLPTVDLVVCHGGAATVHHALAHGCRVLALPTHTEQAMVSLALSARGWGRTLAATQARLEPVAAVGMASALLRVPGPPVLDCPRRPVEDALLHAVQALS